MLTKLLYTLNIGDTWECLEDAEDKCDSRKKAELGADLENTEFMA